MPETAPPAAPPPADTSPLWAEPARGLRILARGMEWRLGVTVTVGVLFVLAILDRSEGLLRFLVLAGPAASIITSIAMAVGLYRFSRFPEGSRSRLASAAFVSMGAVVLFDAYAFKVFLDWYDDMGSAREARHAFETIQNATMLAMALLVCSLVLAAVAMGVMAKRVRPELVRRIAIAGGLVAAAGLSVIGLRAHLWLTDFDIDGDSLLLLSAGVLLFVAAAVLAFADVAKHLAHELRRPDALPAPIPTATVRT